MCAIKSPAPQTAIDNGCGYIGRADCPAFLLLANVRSNGDGKESET